MPGKPSLCTFTYAWRITMVSRRGSPALASASPRVKVDGVSSEGSGACFDSEAKPLDPLATVMSPSFTTFAVDRPNAACSCHDRGRRRRAKAIAGRLLLTGRLGGRQLGSQLLDEVARDVLSMLLDLTHVPALDGRNKGNPHKQTQGDELPYRPGQEEVEVAGVEDVHKPSVALRTDSPACRALPLLPEHGTRGGKTRHSHIDSKTRSRHGRVE